MKRTRDIRLPSSARQTLQNTIKPLTLAIAAASLAACGGNREQVSVVNSVEDCTAKTTLSVEQCEVAYKKALAEAEQTAPRYNSASSCEAEFGYRQCQQSSGGFFMPLMAGYMVGSMLSSNSYGYTNNPVYRYNNPRSSLYNKYMTADGSVIGSPGQTRYNVSKSAIKPKPTVTRTMSRGGFGSAASAKSSWGGGRASGGWGG